MSSDTSKFHKNKKAAAVLKHAVINSYVTPFASKTGKWSAGNRVAFIDGYAGPGRYADGAEGSGAMLVRKAQELAAMSSPRHVEVHFVENDAETADRLSEVAASEGDGVSYTVTRGDVATHLPDLLEWVDGIPAFIYLDPCGLPIPLEQVARIFDRPEGPGLATEVLINLTAGLRRFAGMLYSTKNNEGALRTLDTALGGDWWRSVWLEACPTGDASEDQKMAAELAVVEGYTDRLRQLTGGLGTWVIDVKPRADLKPVYYLVFATRSIHGIVTFGEATSKGLEEWRKHNAEQAADDTLFSDAASWESDWKAEEAKLKARWIATLTERIECELAKGEPFRIIDRPDEIFGNDLIGVVRTLHLRAAINNARNSNKTSTKTTGVADLYNLTITPA